MTSNFIANKNTFLCTSTDAFFIHTSSSFDLSQITMVERPSPQKNKQPQYIKQEQNKLYHTAPLKPQN